MADSADYPRVWWNNAINAWSDRERSFSINHKVVPVNAVVIEVEELPEVTEYFTDQLTVKGETGSWSTYRGEDHYAEALRHLAYARYSADNPPIDQEQVNVLTTLLSQPDAVFGTEEEFARWLVKQGVSVTVKS